MAFTDFRFTERKEAVTSALGVTEATASLELQLDDLSVHTGLTGRLDHA